MRLKVFLLLLLGAIAFSGCDDPTVGELSIDLVSPGSGDGAILFKVETPTLNAITDIVADCPGCQAFTYRVGDSEMYCVVIGALTTGPLVKVVVSNRGFRLGYRLTVVEVAGLDHGLRPTSEYELSVSR